MQTVSVQCCVRKNWSFWWQKNPFTCQLPSIINKSLKVEVDYSLAAVQIKIINSQLFCGKSRPMFCQIEQTSCHCQAQVALRLRSYNVRVWNARSRVLLSNKSHAAYTYRLFFSPHVGKNSCTPEAKNMYIFSWEERHRSRRWKLFLLPACNVYYFPSDLLSAEFKPWTQ